MTAVPLRRLHPNSSENVDTAHSHRAIELVSAAKKIIRKNTTAITRPMGRLAKILGMVINISEGPALRSFAASAPEKANTAGMILRPASMAMPVSKISTCRVESSMLTSFFI